MVRIAPRIPESADAVHPVGKRIAYYRSKAAEVREHATSAYSIEGRESFIAIAESYERLADGLEASRRKRPKE
jgi:hypothetical protein